MLKLEEVCTKCKTPYKKNAKFCSGCGTKVSDNANVIQPNKLLYLQGGLIRRFFAEFIDRLITIPFLVYLFPKWILVIVIYYLFCDSTPTNRSVGKWICRIRVVSLDVMEPCGWLKAVLRRLPSTMCQVSYFFFGFFYITLAYELLSIVFMLLNSQNKCWEDYLIRTQVIKEKDYKQAYQHCVSCKGQVYKKANYCPLCGVQQNSNTRS